MSETIAAPRRGEEAEKVEGHGPSQSVAGLLGLAIASIGVVYGDIGTSPLYAFREAVNAAAGPYAMPTPLAVYGVLSLILWALIFVVTLKYVIVLLRADNNGEGGTLTLMALARKATGDNTVFVVMLGIIGAALFFGDALITPAISVLSAIEGLKDVEWIRSQIDPYIVPLTVAILVVLFAFQSRGTADIARFFGPVMTIWFVAIAVPGAVWIALSPGILLALNPVYGVAFLFGHGVTGLLTLGAVFLAVTGAEALYADLGHFGRRPIQAAWLVLVFPALALNYLGQGALVLADPNAIKNPFFLLYPEMLRLPMVVLATIATVIASQAVITGAYSLTRQAIALGLLPRLEIRHTSAQHEGQIYMPRVNMLILIGVLLLVGLFRSSSALASAYGIAVTGTMVVTAIMAFIVVHKVWGWSLPATIGLIAPFVLVDATFLAANLLKVVEGGWVPLALASVVMVIMYTWRRGSKLLFDKTRRQETPLDGLVAMLEKKPPQRVAGTAVFLTSDPMSAPTALMHSLKHYKVLHEKNVILSIEIDHRPRVPQEERVRIEPVGQTFSRVALRFGYMERPNVPQALGIARKLGWQFDIMSTSFFVSRRKLRPAARSSMPLWQDRLFISLARAASDATDFFQIPTGRVVEVGTQVPI
ncbi:MAG TPA: potassium transporter Kup [Xanthobacteraceae bacterium]|nr:potassium transporter Kup [Xanthobacteraceae bacterium]